MYEVKNPPPGSDEAFMKGCTCPIIDNCLGKGIGRDGAKYGWWIDSDCPIHNEKIEKPKNENRR